MSGRKRAPGDRRGYSSRTGVFQRPSVTSLVWAAVDALTVGVAFVLAMQFRQVIPHSLHRVLAMPSLFDVSVQVALVYVGWFALCLIFITRTYGLYGPIQNRSGLHEQRMTMQATLTAGLLLCGTLFLSRDLACRALWFWSWWG